MHDAVLELLVSEVAARKLGGRGISENEVAQLPKNTHITTRNSSRRSNAGRRLLVGHTDGGRILTLVIEQTRDHGTWLVVTGWTATASERRMLN